MISPSKITSPKVIWRTRMSRPSLLQAIKVWYLTEWNRTQASRKCFKATNRWDHRAYLEISSSKLSGAPETTLKGKTLMLQLCLCGKRKNVFQHLRTPPLWQALPQKSEVIGLSCSKCSSISHLVESRSNLLCSTYLRLVVIWNNKIRSSEPFH